MHDELELDLPPEDIDAAVVAQMLDLYRRRLPVLPRAEAAVRAPAAGWPLGLASSSNREVIALLLELSGTGGRLRGVRLQLGGGARQARSRRLPGGGTTDGGRPGATAWPSKIPATGCAGTGGGHGGDRSAQPGFPPARDALALAQVAVPAIADLTPEVVERAAAAADAD